jgi:hypothetical protein
LTTKCFVTPAKRFIVTNSQTYLIVKNISQEQRETFLTAFASDISFPNSRFTKRKREREREREREKEKENKREERTERGYTHTVATLSWLYEKAFAKR